MTESLITATLITVFDLCTTVHVDGIVTCLHSGLNTTVQETQYYAPGEINDTAHSAALLLNQYQGPAKGFQEDFQEQNKLPAQSSAEFAEAV